MVKSKLTRRVIDDAPRKPDVSPHMRQTLNSAPKNKPAAKRGSKKGKRK